MKAPLQATLFPKGARASLMFVVAHHPLPQRGGGRADLCLNPESYSYRSAVMGSTLVARRAGM